MKHFKLLKKVILSVFLTTIIQTLNAQQSSSTRLNLQGGYDQNVFLAPSFLLRNEIELERFDLWDNGTFQSVGFSHIQKWKLEKSTFRISAAGDLSAYQTRMDANRYEWSFTSAYRIKYANRKYLELAPRLVRKKRQGVNLTDAVLQTPFSYVNLILPVHLDFYLGNKRWLKTEFGFVYKDYDRSEDQVLRYKAPFIGALLSKKWLNAHTTKKLTLKYDAMFRRYLDIDLITSDEDDVSRFSKKERSWNYYSYELSLLIQENEEKWRWEPYIRAQIRDDQTGKNGYLQTEFGTFSKYKLGDLWSLSSKMSYQNRSYRELTPGEGNEEQLLIYNYFRFSANLTYRWTPNATVFTAAELVNRLSNNPDETMLGFRDYQTRLIQVGISYKFR